MFQGEGSVHEAGEGQLLWREGTVRCYVKISGSHSRGSTWVGPCIHIQQVIRAPAVR